VALSSHGNRIRHCKVYGFSLNCIKIIPRLGIAGTRYAFTT
jgi:hypothetical protein